MPGTITPDGRPIHFVAVYAQHHVECRDEDFDSISEAVHFLLSSEDAGDLMPLQIEDTDGHVILGAMTDPPARGRRTAEWRRIEDAWRAGRLNEAVETWAGSRQLEP